MVDCEGPFYRPVGVNPHSIHYAHRDWVYVNEATAADDLYRPPVFLVAIFKIMTFTHKSHFAVVSCQICRKFFGRHARSKSFCRQTESLNPFSLIVIGNPLKLYLTPGNVNDCTVAVDVLDEFTFADNIVIGDKAYGTVAISEFIEVNGGSYYIPPKDNAKQPW